MSRKLLGLRSHRLPSGAFPLLPIQPTVVASLSVGAIIPAIWEKKNLCIKYIWQNALPSVLLPAPTPATFLLLGAVTGRQSARLPECSDPPTPGARTFESPGTSPPQARPQACAQLPPGEWAGSRPAVTPLHLLVPVIEWPQVEKQSLPLCRPQVGRTA